MPPTSSAGGTTDHQLVSYELRAPAWRSPLLLVQPHPQSSSSSSLPAHSASTAGAAAYPELFPGTTSLYPHHPTGSLGGAGSNLPGGGSAIGSASTAATPAREDDLSEAVVKSGFVNRAVVQGEAASIFPFIHEKLLKGPTLPILSSLVTAVLERKHLETPSLASPAGPVPGRALPVAAGSTPWQQEKPVIVPNPGPWTYKPPSRVVFNATRLENWYSELANPKVPLSKLTKNIPSNPSSSSVSGGSGPASGGIGHISSGVGTYGAGTSTAPRPSTTSGGILSGADKPADKNLDMLLHRAVPIDRAIWFLRSVGQAEIQQLTKVSLKSSASASQSGTSYQAQTSPALAYSTDFTNSLLDFLKRQLAEIVLPLIHHATLQASGLAGRAGMSVKGKARNILAEEAPKERWLKRWAYSVELVRETIEQGLVESGRWASGLLEMIKKCHIAQLEWWLDLLRDTALDDISQRHGWTAKQVVVTLLDKLLELEGAQPTALEEAMRNEELLVSARAAVEQMLRALWEQNTATFFQPRIWRERLDPKLARLRGIALLTSGDETAWHELEKRVRRVLGRGDEPVVSKYQALQFELYDPREATACAASAAEAGSRRKGLSGTWSMPSLGTLTELLDRFSPYDSVQETFHTLFPPPIKALPSPFPSAGCKAPPPTPRTPLSTSTAARPPIFVSTPEETLRGLLIWATSCLRTGEHRRYLVTSLFKRFSKSDSRDTAVGDATEERARLLQNTLLEWLDVLPSPAGGLRPVYRQKATVELFTLLADEHLLDVARVLQTAVSRGIGYHTESSPSTYISILQEVRTEGLSRPLAAQLNRFLGRITSEGRPPADQHSMMSRLRLFLGAEAPPPQEHGCDAPGTAILQASPPDSEGPDIQMQDASLDSPSPPSGQPAVAAEMDVLQTIQDLGPQQRRWILRHWVLPALIRQSSWSPAVLTRAARLFHAGSEYQSLADLLQHILASSATPHLSLLSCILNIIDHMALMWSCADLLPSIAGSLWTTHRRLVSEGGISKRLLAILVNLGRSGCISAVQLSDLALDVRAHLRRFAAPHLSEPLASGSVLDGVRGLGDVDSWVATLVARHGASPGFPASVLDQLLYSLETGAFRTDVAAQIYDIVQDTHPEGLEAVLVSKLVTSPGDGATIKLWRKAWLPRLLSLLSTAGSLSPATLLHTLAALPMRAFLDTPSDLNARAEAASILDALQYILSEGSSHQQSLEDTAFGPSPAYQLAAMYMLPLLRDVELAASTESFPEIARAASKLRSITLSAPGTKNVVLQNLPALAAFYLGSPPTESEYKPRSHSLASLDVLAETLNIIKPSEGEGNTAFSGEGGRQSRSPYKPPTAASAGIDIMEESAFLAGVNRVELQAYLRRAELVAAAEEQGASSAPRVALEEDGFAQRFLEDLLSEPGDSGNHERDKQLGAFTGKAVDQLLRAVLRSMCASLEAHEAHTDDASLEVSWKRLLKLAPILRRFISPEDATLGVLEADPSLCQSFILSWLKAAETIVSLTSSAIQSRQAILQLLTLYDVLSLVTGKIDIWITRQADLVDAVKVTLQLADNVRTPDLADVQSLLVDMASYLLTFAVGASTRLLAVRSFRTGPLAILSSPVRDLGILSEPATVTFWQDGQQYLGSANPWELADHVDPPQTSARDDVQQNSGAIDLGRLQAATLELDTAPLPAQSRGPSSAFHLGDQRNFDFELPSLQESIWQRDFRRSNTAQMDLPATAAVTVSDDASASQSVGQKDSASSGTGSNEAHRSLNAARIAPAAHVQSPTSAAASSNASNAKKAAPKKRKSMPEAPREEEEPKRKKVAAKTTAKKK